MATRSEDNIEAHRQVAMLDNAWRELFLTGTQEEQEVLTEQDMKHIPRALGYMLVRMVDECVDGINNSTAYRLAKGDLTPDQATEFQLNALYAATMMIGHRMFKMGQHLTTELPYDKLIPCPCSVLYDEELDDLLKRAAEGPRVVEGSGWVIKDFGRKEEEA